MVLAWRTSTAGGRRFRTRGLPSVDELRTDGLDPVPVLEFGGGCRLAVDPVGGRVVVEDGVPVEELGELETLHGGVPVEEDRRTRVGAQGLKEMVVALGREVKSQREGEV